MASQVLGVFLLLGLLKGGCCLRLADSCRPEVAANILWPSEGAAAFPCNDVHPSLQGGLVRRTCGSDKVWLDVDFSACTLSDRNISFVLIWIPVNITVARVQNMTNTILNDFATHLRLERLSRKAMTPISLTLTTVKDISLTTSSILLRIDFPQIPVPDVALVFNLKSSLISLYDTLYIGDVVVLRGKRRSDIGYEGFNVMSMCSCRPKDSLFDGYCAASLLPIPPCKCLSDSNTCQCHTPEFVGDGNHCTRDIDQDKFPEEPLSSCPNLPLMSSNTSQPSYCIQDNCPLLHNSDQDVTACKAPPTFDGCLSIRGTRLDIVWANTRRGNTDRQLCPLAQGFATRECYSSGQWSKNEDVTMCTSYAFSSTFSSADDVFRRGSTESLGNQLSNIAPVINSLAMLTQGKSNLLVTGSRSFSLLPSDLNSTNLVIDEVLSLLEDMLTSNDNLTGISIVLNKLDDLCIDIFSNVLDGTNLAGWLELTEIGDGTPKLLDNIERLTLYLPQRVEERDNVRRVLKRNNIVISYLKKPLTSASAVVFPESVADLEGSLDLDYIPAQVQLPAKLFEQRRESLRQSVPSSTFIVRNMEFAMPRKIENGNNATRIASMILAAQVSGRGSNLPQLADDPIKLMFQFDPVENASSYHCAYWMFSDPIGNGFWAFDGIEMTSMETNNEEMVVVNCSATHLTSFAILVDVKGTLSDINQTELEVLTYISYFGCTITILFLIITIIFFLAQGRELFVKVQYFIHLNLAVSLFLAYTLFVVGGATATAIKEACTAVAVLLHYLMLSTFCWMLCEGIMLYLLLVVIFSTLSRRIWFFLLIGYALPIFPVVVSLGIRYGDYVVTNQDGNITFCWLSTNNELVWAFVGPMLAIILINCVFLSMALYKVYKIQRSKRQRMTIQKKFSQRECTTMNSTNKDSVMNLGLFKSLVGSVIVLQPMLGLTWILGLIFVNKDTTVFAWLFTVINSLQGLFIFVFHVVKTDKVWNSPRLVRFRSQVSTYKLSSRGTLSTTSTTGAYSNNSTTMELDCHNGNNVAADPKESRKKPWKRMDHSLHMNDKPE